MKLRLLLSTLLMIAGCGSDSKPKLKIDPDLVEYFESFKEDCQTSWRKPWCDARLPYVSSVLFVKEMENDFVGTAQNTWVRGQLRILIRISEKTPDVRLTMYHELGHAIGVNHMGNSCIMAPQLQWVSNWGGWEKCKWVFFNVK